MKVGDLVQLSAYGKRLKSWYVGRDNDLGVIISVSGHGWFRIMWSTDGKVETIDRREIKYAKIKKNVNNK